MDFTPLDLVPQVGLQEIGRKEGRKGGREGGRGRECVNKKQGLMLEKNRLNQSTRKATRSGRRKSLVSCVCVCACVCVCVRERERVYIYIYINMHI